MTLNSNTNIQNGHCLEQNLEIGDANSIIMVGVLEIKPTITISDSVSNHKMTLKIGLTQVLQICSKMSAILINVYIILLRYPNGRLMLLR